ncbi:putative autotransporter adhesin-like protein [Winogradskyella epiphytica]|uniref:Putative autotransporter adhesin-like protein n=1 Tax=Winogradskyella epiphytica TaxID=262005 RepID=A0A2V4Y0W2_9FLAO|nr:head GIN domain-containing protein [Winogradskyella epiphytica]PYE82048.1 putative autotransporter adhesin-like protein [Winogradskyella epiphytica]GGW60826.1 hypothetical protein GCM10008085_10460 [Winogradskyella epiphytica]
MTTLTKIIVTSILSLLMLSCVMGKGIKGNGDVISEVRNIPSNFNAIKVSQGLDLYITQSNDVSLSVEADSNLHEIIMTEVEDGELRIYTTENIQTATSRKIMLSISDITAIKATSGSDVFTTNTLEVKNLKLTCTSGADMSLNVKTEQLSCETTSGSDIKLRGSTKEFIAKATSGSEIDASELKTEVSEVNATSGADISVNVSKELTANATSGADIRYTGNPEKINASDSSSGSVKKQ